MQTGDGMCRPPPGENERKVAPINVEDGIGVPKGMRQGGVRSTNDSSVMK